jgi:hypothetical protein
VRKGGTEYACVSSFTHSFNPWLLRVFFCDQPVAGAMLVPVDKAPARDVRLQHPASWRSRLRFLSLGRRPPIASDVPPADPSPESPASSSESVHLTVLISMPTPLAHGKARQDNEGPPVVELGIAQVTYTSSTTLL